MKYVGQILLEVELTAEDFITAEVEARDFANRLQEHSNEHWNRKIELINTCVLKDPDDKEFLNRYFEHRGEIYEVVD